MKNILNIHKNCFPGRAGRLGMILGGGVWPRFTEYVLRKDGRVGPSQMATIRDWYCPFDHAPNILKDFLDLRTFLSRSEDQTQIYISNRNKGESQVLSFCNKWGGFGLDWNMSMEIPGLRELCLKELGSTQKRLIASNCNAKLYHSLFVDPGWGSPFYDISQNKPKRFPKIDSLVENHLRKCAEDIDHIAKKWIDMVDFLDNTCRDWLNIQNIELTLIKYHEDGRTKICYGFDTLISAIGIMLVLNALSDVYKVKMCVQCGRSFSAYRERALYCSRECGVLFRVRRHRRQQSTPKNCSENCRRIIDKTGENSRKTEEDKNTLKPS